MELLPNDSRYETRVQSLLSKVSAIMDASELCIKGTVDIILGIWPVVGVVILGAVGRNFAAAMSGGFAFVYDQ